jgi:DNA topoisomerase-1
MAKKTTRKKTTTAKKTTRSSGRRASTITAKEAEGKHLVIVESPTKAKTINKYLGSDYVVMASVGHVRDLPSRAPKGQKQLVPGVDLEHDFEPTYEILPDKKQTVADLRKVAKAAADVWFATDLDREGEAIAWHLAQALNVPVETAKRVVFNAITKDAIQAAFTKPRPIDGGKVNAQQARRILDRIVGYQVSPLLWKKVAGGLSAGRVQSVATRLVVEREREIEKFIPEEYWKITGYFTPELTKAAGLSKAWRDYLASGAEGVSRTMKDRIEWLNENQGLRAELVEVAGEAFKPESRDVALTVAKKLGFVVDEALETQDEAGRGPAKHLCVYQGHLANPPKFHIGSIQTRRVSSKPGAPFITSTLQQQASTRLGFALQRTMRVAQQLYEGIDLKGIKGQTGLITYMRTDSTFLSGEALSMARDYIKSQFGDKYLPDKPNFYSSSNKDAQEAHEAIRPTDVTLTPQKIRSALGEEQYKLYKLIWERFVSCQMVPAQWDSTSIQIVADAAQATFRTTGRTLVFDGFYRATGVPKSGEEAILPPLKEQQELAPLDVDPTQHFTSPPPRYTEASLQKKLEEEGIGRPSTYAAIIQTIQDRKYVEQLSLRDRRLMASDLGKVVTDKLVEAFPKILNVAYTREMESELDKIESEHHDWVKMLHDFYGPFAENLRTAHDSMTHAKAETEPAPYKCEKCGAGTMYRFGKNGRFLSCSRYPDCDYAAPIDREGKPQQPEMSDILCPKCGGGMTRRVGRFGPFLGCTNYPACDGIVKVDPKKGTVVLPKPPPLQIDVPCPKCSSPLNLRRSARGPWLSCSNFPKCRGRGAWSSIEEKKQEELLKALDAHEASNPVPEIRNTSGQVIGDDYIVNVSGGDDTASAAPGEPATVETDAA